VKSGNETLDKLGLLVLLETATGDDRVLASGEPVSLPSSLCEHSRGVEGSLRVLEKREKESEGTYRPEAPPVAEKGLAKQLVAVEKDSAEQPEALAQGRWKQVVQLSWAWVAIWD